MVSWKEKFSKNDTVKFALFVIAFAVVGQIALSSYTPVKNLALRTTENLAGIIGVVGAVEPNEYNTLAQQFSEKEKELTLREEALLLREKALSGENNRTTLSVLLGVTLLLLILLILNFYLDWRRGAHVNDTVSPHHNEFSTRL